MVWTAPPPVPLVELDGTYAWSHTSSDKGVKRVESEQWTIASDETALTAHYTRRVEFIDESGVGFRCSQSDRYVLESRFELEGTRATNHATLVEKSATRVPSPCSAGEPPLTEYRLQTAPTGGLMVTSEAGSQTLVAGPTVDSVERPTTLAGDWKWRAQRTRDDGVTRSEVEKWQLAVANDLISGTYERTVSLSSKTDLRCAGGKREVAHTDKYTVRGWVRDGYFELSELEVDPDANLSPCFAAESRHLDVAKGTVYRDHVVLIWRAERRQVLSRPPAAP